MGRRLGSRRIESYRGKPMLFYPVGMLNIDISIALGPMFLKSRE